MKPAPAEVQAPACPFLGPHAGTIARSARKLFGVPTHLLLSVFALIAASAPNTHATELDDARHFRLESQPSLAWDNLRNGPQVIRGVSPRYSFKHRLHVCELRPGQSTTILVPPNEMVRVAGASGAIDWEDVELWTSNGSGLYLRQMSAQCKCGTSLLVAPGSAKMSVAQIRRPASENSTATVAIFTSRSESARILDSFREAVRVNGAKSVKLAYDRGRVVEPMSFVESGESASFQVALPARLMIETRLLYQPADSKSKQTHFIRLSIGGKLLRVIEISTSHESNRRITVNGESAIVGKLEKSFADIQSNPGDIVLESTAPIYFRVVRSDTAVQRPRLNGSRVQTVAKTDPISIWDLDQPTLDAPLAGDPQSISVFMLAAKRSAKDNRFPRGGLRSYMMMRKLAQTSTSPHRMRSLAEKFRSSHTTFRDLLPTASDQPVAISTALFSTPQLRDPRRADDPTILHNQFVHDAVGQLAKGHFSPLSSNRHQPNVYRLPADLGTSILRMAIDQDSAQKTGSVFVQYDYRRPIQLRLANERMPRERLKLNTADIGLAELKRQHAKFDANTLGGPFAQMRAPAPRINAGTAELLLPASIQTILVWSESTDVRVALQYLDGSSHQLNEHSLRTMIAKIENSGPVTALLDEDESQNFAHSELQNHAVAFRRLVNSHRSAFGDTVAKDLSPQQSVVKTISKTDFTALHRAAAKLTSEQQWCAAVEAWSEVVNATTGFDRSMARLRRVDALLNAGEHFLAERELRGLALYSHHKETRQAALDKLIRWKHAEGDLRGAERIQTVVAFENRSSKNIAGLSRMLFENGRHQAALDLALSLPTEGRPNDVVARAAFRLAWWQTFDEAVANLPQEDRQFWVAQKSLRFGKYEKALARFESAGKRGEEFARHLKEGMEIHQKLFGSDELNRAEWIKQWEQWQGNHPGPVVWREEPEIVANCDGFATLHSKSRDIYTNYIKATARQPAVIEVHGPVRLQVELRPLHDRDTTRSIDDWVHVSGTSMHQVVSISANTPTAGLEIIGDNNHVPGGAARAEIHVGPGRHQLKLKPEQYAMLVRIKVARPELPIPVLPPISKALVENRSVSEGPNNARSLANASAYHPDSTVNRAALLVWTAERGPARRRECAVELFALCEEHPENGKLAALKNRLTRSFGWSPFREYEASAGMHAIEIEGWQPESPAMRIRRSMLMPTFDADHLLSADQDFVLNLRNVVESEFELEIARPQLSYVPTHPSVVEWQLGNGETQTIELVDPQSRESIHVRVPAGQHQLRIRLKNAMPLNYVLLKIRERLADGQTVPLKPRKRFYQVATADEPVRFQIEGPSVVRIDELRDGTTRSRIETINSGTREFELKPVVGQAAALFRVFELVDSSQPTSQPTVSPQQKTVPELPKPWLDPLVDAVFATGPPRIADLSLLSPDAPAPNVRFDDEFSLSDQERGTWTLGMGLFQRAALEEDNNLAQPGQFMQFSATRNRFDAWKEKYYQTDWLLRTRDAAGPVWGLVHNQWTTLPSLRSLLGGCQSECDSPIDVSGRGYVFLQRPGTPTIPGAADTHLTVGLQGRISQTRRWSDQAYHKPSLTVFGRWLTMDQNTFGPAEADEDLFTPFKSDHRIGMRISDRFVYQRWLDSKWWLRPALMTNEDFNLAKPDNISLQTGMAQLWGPLEFAFSYKAIRYLSDKDRRNNSTQHLFYADAILQHWRCAGRRNEMSVSFRHDLGDGGTSASLVFTTVFDRGRGYRDVHPSQVSFLPIRNDRAARHRLLPHLQN